MKYKAVIFDLDGTILNTLDDLYNSVNFSLEKNNLPLRTKKEVRAFVGNGIRLLIERAVPEKTTVEITDKCFNDFKAHYKNNSAVFTKPYENINTVLTKLKNSGVKLAVVSNKADFAVQTLVEDYFPSIFDFAVGEKENVRRKPYPDSVNCAIDNLGANRNECIYVGDSDVDIETARNANMPCISVLWGFRDESFLKSFSPEYIINDPNEILEIIGV